MSKRGLTKYRVVCQSVDERITLRTKARDEYKAFEQIIMFLRAKGFDYQVVLVEQS